MYRKKVTSIVFRVNLPGPFFFSKVQQGPGQVLQEGQASVLEQGQGLLQALEHPALVPLTPS